MSHITSAVIGLAAFVTACGVIGRSKPARWLWRTLVAQPIMGAFRREVAEVVRSEVPRVVRAELRKHPMTNGWGVQAMTAVAKATGAAVPPVETHSVDPDPDADDEAA